MSKKKKKVNKTKIELFIDLYQNIVKKIKFYISIVV